MMHQMLLGGQVKLKLLTVNIGQKQIAVLTAGVHIIWTCFCFRESKADDLKENNIWILSLYIYKRLYTFSLQKCIYAQL